MSEMIQSEVEHAYWHDNALVALVQNVPSWVCQLCNFRSLDNRVELNLKRIVADYVRLGHTFPIPKTPYRTILARF